MRPCLLPHAYYSATKHSAHLPENHHMLHELFTLKLALCLEEHDVPDELLLFLWRSEHPGRRPARGGAQVPFTSVPPGRLAMLQDIH